MHSARRRTAAILVTVGALVIPLAAAVEAAPMRASEPSPGAHSPGASTTYTKRAITVPVLVGPERDIACTIVADLYRPTGVDAGHRAPAILTTHGFGGAKDDSNQAGIGKGFAQQGYVVLSYSGLGFGGSDCKIYLDNPAYDGVAGRQLVSVLAGEKDAFTADTGTPFRIRYVAEERPGDPRVGMIGGSYGGQIQYAVAQQDSRVDALIPIITWSDLAYSLAPNNTSFRRGVTYDTAGVHKRLWTSFFFAVGISDGVAGAAVDPARNVGCPNFDDRACVAKVQLEAQGYPDDTTTAFARTASVSSYLDRIQVPTLLVQGQKDTLFNLQEAVATYKGLRQRGVETRMIWQSWGHSLGGTPAPGEIDLGADDIRDTYLGRRFLNWMNHHVRGNDEAPLGKRFCYFRDWVSYDERPARAGQAIAQAYACHDRYTGDDVDSTLYFSGSDGLTKAKGTVATGSTTYVNAPGAATSYSETSALEGVAVNNPPTDAPGTFAAFTSNPLSRAVNIVGVPRLRLHLDAPTAELTQNGGPAGQLMLFAKIYDVAPDGTQTLHNRLVSPVRVTDVTKAVTVELPGVVQRIDARHRIRVVIAASDLAYNGNTTIHPVTVHTSPGAPSLLRLPVGQGALQFG